ncbi:hypothetical protein D6D15_07266 [Aureobasidium pullulans]|uniref:Uncharacterized protein n=1 Tax=Aureobasidium pullulans TaxID=5580 RepID=A0A4S9B273_AURPU|nr:hypothetical protein D6D15_07266 [Aureobasidium pullulans]
MTRTDKQVHDEMTEASFDQTIQFSELDSMLALTMKDLTSSPSPVRRGASTKSSVWSTSCVFSSATVAMVNISSSVELITSNIQLTDDLGCNITTGNTRSSDVLDLPLSGVTLVIGRILGPYDNDNGYYNEGEDDFYHGDRNSDYYRL